MKTPRRFEVYLVKFEHSVGAEIKGTRPAVVLFPKEPEKKSRLMFVAPMTTGGRGVPASKKVKTRFNGRDGYILLTQTTHADKSRIIKHLGRLSEAEAGRLWVAYLKINK